LPAATPSPPHTLPLTTLFRPPDLLGTDADGTPQAELWLGAHHGAPSSARSDDGSAQPLPHLISDAPHRVLGAEVTERFGARLPRSEEHTSELQSRFDLVCRLL